MSGIITKRARSFPVFWIGGGIAGPGFIVMGCIIIHSFLGLDPAGRDGSMLFAGISILILGLALLAGVIITLRIMANPNDLSFNVDVTRAKGRKKYNADRLINRIGRCHNNCLLFNTDEGQMRVFGAGDKLITEIFIPEKDGFKTYHLTDPLVTDEDPVILSTVFFERFPVRKNRLNKKEPVIKAIGTLYETQSLAKTAALLPFTDTTEETKILIENDAYIIPAVPLVFPKKQKDRDRAVKEKEERENRAMQVLRSNKS